MSLFSMKNVTKSKNEAFRMALKIIHYLSHFPMKVLYETNTLILTKVLINLQFDSRQYELLNKITSRSRVFDGKI